MYQPKARNPLSSFPTGKLGDLCDDLWPLLMAIGTFWKLEDDLTQYRSTFEAFIDNRIAQNPLYPELYRRTIHLFKKLKEERGIAEACEVLFVQKDHHVPTQLTPTGAVPLTENDFLQTYVINELIQFRVAFGGFREFGAINYCGFFGGANIQGKPVPYRTPRVSQ